MVTVRQHANRLSLFDLPPELRMQIYGYISADIDSLSDDAEKLRIEDYILTVRKDWPNQRQATLRNRNAHFRDFQLVSRQVRSEFLATWAEQVTHHGDVLHLTRWPSFQHYSGRRASKELSGIIWRTVRGMLQNVEDRLGVARNVRHIKLFVRLTTFFEGAPTERLALLNSALIAERLDLLDDSLAHPELVIEVEVVCTHGGDSVFHTCTVHTAATRWPPGERGE